MASGLFVVALSSTFLVLPAEDSFLFLDQGLSSKSPLLSPGKIDLLYRHTEPANEYNLMLWAPVFKGGAGVADFRDSRETTFGGGFLRPLLPWPGSGELILGAQAVDANDVTDHEVQGEYRFPFGLGLGGGMVERTESPADVWFGKVDFRKSLRGWSCILELQAQEVAEELSPGGYAAVHTDELMAVYGNDGEQWRATLGYLAPEKLLPFDLRPALEVLYVDNTIGDLDGPKMYFANATFRYLGGFLSHPARLGRAMGPQGLEFGNPLGFLQPTWNRRLELWEMGALADLRAVHTELPSGRTAERYEGLLFPSQLDDRKSFLDFFFAGAFYLKDPVKESPGILVGAAGSIRFLDFSADVEYELESKDWTVVVGLIDRL